MSNYPAKMAVVIADFVTIDGDQQCGEAARFVFLNAFCILKIERRGRGFHFDELRQNDEGGNDGAELLLALADAVDDETSLAGYRIDQLVGSLVRVPCGDVREAECKPALLKLKAALGNEVQDAYWYDQNRHRTLEDLASDYDLPAQWHRQGRQVSPNMLERELSAKAQSVWLSIANELLATDELRRASADYDQWRTSSAIA